MNIFESEKGNTVKLIKLHLEDSGHVGQEVWINADHIVSINQHQYPGASGPATRIALSCAPGWEEGGERVIHVGEKINTILETLRVV